MTINVKTFTIQIYISQSQTCARLMKQSIHWLSQTKPKKKRSGDWIFCGTFKYSFFWLPQRVPEYL